MLRVTRGVRPAVRLQTLQQPSFNGCQRLIVPTRSFVSVPDSVTTVGVVGAGQMGGGIAQVLAQTAKLDVVMVDVDESRTNRSLALMDKLFDKQVGRGKMTAEEVNQAKGRIRTSSDTKSLNDADIIIEAASEATSLKEKIFRDLDAIAKPEAILASNTSSISITKIGGFTNRPEKVVGMHFMNPVPVMKLVEVIPGVATSSETLQTTIRLAEGMGKTVAQSDDRPGFIANRLLMPYINEAVFALQDGIGDREAIDTTMKLGCNMPMGPLMLADFIGLDTCLAIMKVLYTELGDSKYRPSPMLTKMVDAGWLGVKSGKGFYDHSKQ